MTNQTKAENRRAWLRLAPLLFVVAALPLISKQCSYTAKYAQYNWFQESDTVEDFFLYGKTVFFLAAAAVMLALLLYERIKEGKRLQLVKSFLPLAGYGLCIVLSAIFSDYPEYVWSGCYEQFESVFVLLGYLLTAYYAFLFIETEREVILFSRGLTVGAVLVGLIALSQTLKHDFFATEFGAGLLMNAEAKQEGAELVFNMGDMAYGTLYNPNYLGVFCAMLIPVFTALAFAGAKKNKWYAAGYFAVVALLLAALFGSQSKAGFLVLAGVFVVACAFLWRFFFKRWYVFVPVMAVAVVLFFAVNASRDNILINQLKAALTLEKETPPLLTSFVTKKDGVVMKYNGHELVLCVERVEGEEYLAAYEEEKEVELIQTGERTFVFAEEDLAGVVLESGRLFGYPAVAVTAGGTNWYFTNDTKEGRYLYVNEYVRSIDCIEAESLFFEGYEKFATSRGYIWSRTLPLLKENWLLGSGPNTFGVRFPQNEYVARFQNGFYGQIMTKPHNMYLQIAVQTGIPSLFCFLAFCVLYLLQSCKTYAKGRFQTNQEKIGFGIFMAVLAYLVSALTNDSMIVLAPMFFALLGAGMAINRMVIAERKEQNP